MSVGRFPPFAADNLPGWEADNKPLARHFVLDFLGQASMTCW